MQGKGKGAVSGQGVGSTVRVRGRLRYAGRGRAGQRQAKASGLSVGRCFSGELRAYSVFTYSPVPGDADGLQHLRLCKVRHEFVGKGLVPTGAMREVCLHPCASVSVERPRWCADPGNDMAPPALGGGGAVWGRDPLGPFADLVTTWVPQVTGFGPDQKSERKFCPGWPPRASPPKDVTRKLSTRGRWTGQVGEVLRGGIMWPLLCAPVLLIYRSTMNIDLRGVLHNDDEDRGCVSSSDDSDNAPTPK